MSKLKTTKRKVKHLRKAYHRLIIDSNKMVSVDDVSSWIFDNFPDECNKVPPDYLKHEIAMRTLERSKNSFYEHCIKPYSDTTREKFEVEYQEKFGGNK